MATVIERLEELAERATAAPLWTLKEDEDGRYLDVAVPHGVTEPYESPSWTDSFEFSNEDDAEFIVAAVNALSDLLKLARAAAKASDVLLKFDPEFNYLHHAELNEALEPLFREDPL